MFSVTPGSQRLKVVPSPSWLWAWISPPWSSTIVLTLVSPRPVPVSVRVWLFDERKKGVKMLPMSLELIPIPWSVTSMNSLP